MKFIVDVMPSANHVCPFRYHNCEYGMICKLTNKRCKDMADCDCLQSIEDYEWAGDNDETN